MNSERLDAVITDYLKETEAGRRPDAEAWIAAHPDLADDLRAFLQQNARMERLAADLATVAPAEAVDVPTLHYVGDYEIVREIARGGMGVVFRARQATLNREVAVKMLLSGALAGEADLARFRTETNAAAALDHPNILPLYEVGDHEGRPYFSMKLVEGGSLAERIGRMTPRESAALLATVARAVHHAHQRGVIHRDLKPANILLDADGTPYVSDFGLARQGADRGQTQTGQVLGTPSYMAPEQARAEKTLTTSVDVYALGAILYECLTGKPPFRTDSVYDTILQVIRKEPDPIPGDLGVIALKCLRKEPGQRYESALTLAEDLERWLRGEPILARPVSTRERVVKWMRRNPVIASLVLACLIAVIVGSVSSMLFALEAKREARIARTQEVEARRRLARSNVISGNRLLEAGDAFGALVWFAEALKLEVGTDRERMHRLRIGMLLRTAPRLTSVWRQASGRRSMDNNGRVVTVFADPNAHELHDAVTGRPLGRVTTSSPILSSELSRDGNTLLAIGSQSHTLLRPKATEGWSLRLWSLPDVKPITAEVEVKPAPVWAALTPDGKRVLMLRQDGRVAIRDLIAGREVVSEAGYTNVELLDLTPDGKRLLVAEKPTDDKPIDADATLRVLDGTTLKPAGKPFRPTQPHDRIPAFGQLADGSLVLVARPDAVATLHPDGGEEKGVLPLHGVKAFTVSTRGGLVAVYGTEGVRVWDLQPAENILDRTDWGESSGRKAEAVRFSPDLDRIVVAESGGWADLRLYDRRNGRPLTPSLHHLGMSLGGAFTTDGKRLVTADASGLVRIWDVTDRLDPPLRQPPAAGPWNPSGDRTRFASATDGVLRVFDGRTGEPVGTPLGGHQPGFSWRLNADGSQALTYDRQKVRLWDVAAGTAREVPLDRPAKDLSVAQWTPDDQHLWLTFKDGKRFHTRFFDAVTLRPITTDGPGRDPEAGPLRLLVGWLVYAPAGIAPVLKPDKTTASALGKTLVVKGGMDGTVVVWDETREQIRFSRKLDGPISLLEVGPGDRWLLAVAQLQPSGRKMLHRLDLTTGEPAGPPVELPPETISLRPSPDGTRLAVFTLADRSFHIRDVLTGAQLTPLLAGDQNTTAFSPDGRLIVINGVLYDAGTGDPLSPTGQIQPGSGGFRADGTGLLVQIQGRDRIRPPGPRVDDANADFLYAHPLVHEEGTPEEILTRAELLSSRKVNANGALVDLTPEEVLARWEAAR